MGSSGGGGGSKGSKGGSGGSAPAVASPNLDQQVLGSNSAQVIGGPAASGGQSQFQQLAQSFLQQQPSPNPMNFSTPGVPNFSSQTSATPQQQAGLDWLEPSESPQSPGQKPTNPEFNDILNSTLGYWLQQ